MESTRTSFLIAFIALLCQFLPAYAQDALTEAYVVQGRQAYARGNYQEAQRLFQEALTALEAQSTNLERLDIAALLNDLAQASRRNGDYTKAETCLKSSISIKEKLLGTNSLKVATSLENLAEVYIEDNKYPEAEALLRKAITIREWKQGKYTIDTASDYLDLGEVYLTHHQAIDEAIRNINTAKAKWTAKFGSKDPRVGKCWHKLAIAYERKNDRPKALSCFDTALGVYSKSLPGTKENIAKLKLELHELCTDEAGRVYNAYYDKIQFGSDKNDPALLPLIRQMLKAYSRLDDPDSKAIVLDMKERERRLAKRGAASSKGKPRAKAKRRG